ncbi:MAG: hypothetical protein BV459_01140 [Thermoplasmata archaeon M11B2D]|nr:MAG: hypothetical protein BV459_01140 [Thermoplasmata archaeon M11B2D]PNX54278.1 MAG: hypothetical protein BV458_00230 [Thermoplasmata archaeon M9B2D]
MCQSLHINVLKDLSKTPHLSVASSAAYEGINKKNNSFYRICRFSNSISPLKPVAFLFFTPTMHRNVDNTSLLKCMVKLSYTRTELRSYVLFTVSYIWLEFQALESIQRKIVWF